MHPKISIITVSYNQGEFLGEAMESVLGQGYPNLEYIVIDGGSSDGSVETIKAYGERIDYWISEPDSGQSEALNKGFQKATGDIIGWLNSDDSYRPGTFHAVAEAFRDPQVQIAMSEQFAYIQSDGIAYGSGTNSFVDHQTLIRFWRTGGMTINQPCVFFRWELFKNVGGRIDETLDFAMDYDLWLRLTERASIKTIQGTWANYRFHGGSKSGRGFHRFFPEWKSVSRRYWGKWYHPVFYRYLFEYLFYLVLRASGRQSSPYDPPDFDRNAGYRVDNDNPRVSVIITNYNYGQFVDAAIESALNQDYDNVEVIVVDDGSDDNSHDAIRKFDGRICSIFKENGGQASAFNAGVSRATGDILCFLDADDTWDSTKVRKVVEKYAEAPWGLVCHDLAIIDDRGERHAQETYCSFYGLKMESGNLFDGIIDNAYPWVFSATSGMSIPARLSNEIFPLEETRWKISADLPLAYAAAYLAPVGVLENSIGCYRTHGRNYFFAESHYNHERRRTMTLVGPIRAFLYLRDYVKDPDRNDVGSPMDHYWFYRRWCFIASAHPWRHLLSLYRKNVDYFSKRPHLVAPGLAMIRQLILDTLMTILLGINAPIRHRRLRQYFRRDFAGLDETTRNFLGAQDVPPKRR